MLWPFSAVTGVRSVGSGAEGTKFDFQPGPSGLVRPAAGRSGRGRRAGPFQMEAGGRRAGGGAAAQESATPRGGVAPRPGREAAPSPPRWRWLGAARGAGVNGRRAGGGCGAVAA